jgi:hypothetical protein
MPWEIIAASKGKPKDQASRLFGPYADHQKCLAEQVLTALIKTPTYKWVELRRVDASNVDN